MTAPSPLREEELLRFCGDHVSDLLSMELLAFWGRHPNCRFTIDAVTCAMDAKRRNVERALNGLLAEDLIVTSVHNDTTLYYLTPDETKRQPILDLAALGWHERRAILERLAQKH
jgi:hypothetical protein